MFTAYSTATKWSTNHLMHFNLWSGYDWYVSFKIQPWDSESRLLVVNLQIIITCLTFWPNTNPRPVSFCSIITMTMPRQKKYFNCPKITCLGIFLKVLFLRVSLSKEHLKQTHWVQEVLLSKQFLIALLFKFTQIFSERFLPFLQQFHTFIILLLMNTWNSWLTWDSRSLIN